ncbi:hypothetical protein ATO13_22076 [Stappia sp. 22II-S9-Z10]|nr:hypothetical protein ATO13_22076 [Stappia sp. 22II-S9-Z10]
MVNRHDDTGEIDAALRSNLEGLLDVYAPGWERKRDRAYPTGDTESSFMVTIQGKHRGGFSRFSQSIHGGPIKLLAYLLNGQSGEPTTADLRLAFDEARKFLGLDDRPVDHAAAQEAQRAARERQELQRAEAEAKALVDLEARQNNAWGIWEHAQALAGTAGAGYLRGRGIMLEVWPEALRWAPRIKHGPSGQWSSAIICRVDGPGGDFLGIWRIYVTSDGQKAFGKASKMGLGPTAGGAVRLFPEHHGEIGLAEGVETALSVERLAGLPTWAALSTSGMAGFEVPFEVETVRIFPDHDDPRRKRGTMQWQPSPGLSAAEGLKARLDEEGTRCFIDRSRPRRKRDYNDVLMIVSARAS